VLKVRIWVALTVVFALTIAAVAAATDRFLSGRKCVAVCDNTRPDRSCYTHCY